jgi:hypothetical protein
MLRPKSSRRRQALAVIRRYSNLQSALPEADSGRLNGRAANRSFCGVGSMPPPSAIASRRHSWSIASVTLGWSAIFRTKRVPSSVRSAAWRQYVRRFVGGCACPTELTFVHPWCLWLGPSALVAGVSLPAAALRHLTSEASYRLPDEADVSVHPFEAARVYLGRISDPGCPAICNCLAMSTRVRVMAQVLVKRLSRTAQI